jgi:hypothetical protein
LTSNMANKEPHLQVGTGTTGFIDHQYILLDTKTKSIGLIDPEILPVIDFRDVQMAAILNFKMAVGQYLKMFVICLCTPVPNLVLLSQNAQYICLAAPLIVLLIVFVCKQRPFADRLIPLFRYWGHWTWCQYRQVAPPSELHDY